MFNRRGKQPQRGQRSIHDNLPPNGQVNPQSVDLSWFPELYALPDCQTSSVGPYTIEKFSNDDRDDPFVPSNLVQPQCQNGQAAFGTIDSQAPNLHSNYFNYNEVKQSADVVTNYDSGYGGSCQTGTLASPSLQRDDGSVAPPLVHNSVAEDHSYAGATVSSDPCRVSENSKPKQLLRCDGCGKTVKCPSELNKHKARHTKPHKCKFPACKGKGFATSNDLERHNRTKHIAELPTSQNVIFYYCIHCDEAPQRRHTPTTRKDNFLTHLAKRHEINLSPSQSLEKYIVRNQIAAVSNRQVSVGNLAANQDNDLQGVGTGLTSNVAMMSDADFSHLTVREQTNYTQGRVEGFRQKYLGKYNVNSADVGKAMMISLGHSGISGRHGEHPDSQYISPNVLSQEVCSQIGRPYSSQPDTVNMHDNIAGFTQSVEPSDQAAKGFHDTFFGDANKTSMSAEELMPTNYHATESQETDLQEYFDLESYQESPKPDPDPAEFATNNSEHHEQVDQYAIVTATRDEPGDVMNSVPSTRQDGMEDDVAGIEDVASESSKRCSECSKLFKRPSELRKHMKRHQKPYGCTFRDCPRVFGSKNDWSRHERSQHIKDETWICKESNCGKLHGRREIFRNHLQGDHKITAPGELAGKLRDYKVVNPCGSRFWCGFCQTFIEVSEMELRGDSWKKRFDHIDNHFFGKGGMPLKSLSEWMHLERADQGLGLTESTNGQDYGEKTSNSSSEVLGKRRANDVEDNSRRKKLKTLQKVSRMWTCCNCQSFLNAKTTPRCLTCEHTRCNDNCKLEYIYPREQEDGE